MYTQMTLGRFLSRYWCYSWLSAEYWRSWRGKWKKQGAARTQAESNKLDKIRHFQLLQILCRGISGKISSVKGWYNPNRKKKKWKSLTREEMRLSSDNKSLLHCVQNWNSSDPSLEACLVSLPSMVWITSSSMTNQALESKPLLQTAPRNKRNQWLAPGPLCKAQLLTGTAYCPLCICSWTGDTSQNSLLLQHGMAKPLFQSLCHVAPSNVGFCGLMAG